MPPGDDDLKGFKISDMRKPKVRATKPGGPSQGKKQAEAPAAESVGFPLVEQMLQDMTVEQVADALRESYEKLEELSRTGDMRKKGGAKRAMAAYERAADLFEYLFTTKASIAAGGQDK